MSQILFIADDFAYQEESDKYIRKLAPNLSLISILPNFRDFKKTDFPKGETNLALHINLIEGKPLREGEFYALPVFLFKAFLGKISKKKIEQEIEEQIKQLQKKGIKIKELNSHQHTHAFYPFSEIVIKLAKKYSIQYIRSYKNIKCFTLKAKTTYLILRILATLSSLLGGKGFTLPSTWHIDSNRKDVYMSWEGRDFDFSKYQDKEQLNLIIHPRLPFDSNTSFYKILELNHAQ